MLFLKKGSPCLKEGSVADLSFVEMTVAADLILTFALLSVILFIRLGFQHHRIIWK